MGTLALKNDKATAEEFARLKFSEDPYLSIDEVARLLDKDRYHKLHKSELARIRIWVKQQLANSGKLPAQPPVIRKKEAFNPPRIVPEAGESMNVAVKQEVKPQSQPEIRRYQPSSKKERADFLYTWADQHPNATIHDARKALMDKFGMAVGTAFIAETLKLARQVAGLEPKPQEKPLAQIAKQVEEQPKAPVLVQEPLNATSIQGIVAAMRTLGLKKVEIKPDGGVSFDAAF